MLSDEQKLILKAQAFSIAGALQDFNNRKYIFQWWWWFLICLFIIGPITILLLFAMIPLIKYSPMISWYTKGGNEAHYNIYLSAYYNYFRLYYDIGQIFVGFCEQLNPTLQYFLSYFILNYSTAKGYMFDDFGAPTDVYYTGGFLTPYNLTYSIIPETRYYVISGKSTTERGVIEDINKLPWAFYECVTSMGITDDILMDEGYVVSDSGKSIKYICPYYDSSPLGSDQVWWYDINPNDKSKQSGCYNKDPSCCCLWCTTGESSGLCKNPSLDSNTCMVTSSMSSSSKSNDSENFKVVYFKKWPPAPTNTSDPWYPVWKSIIRDCWGGAGSETDPNNNNSTDAVNLWINTGDVNNELYRCNFLYELYKMQFDSPTVRCFLTNSNADGGGCETTSYSAKFMLDLLGGTGGSCAPGGLVGFVQGAISSQVSVDYLWNLFFKDETPVPLPNSGADDDANCGATTAANVTAASMMMLNQTAMGMPILGATMALATYAAGQSGSGCDLF